MEQTEKSEGQQAREAIAALKDLQKHPGWDIIRQNLQGQINARVDKIILEPRSSRNSEWEQEYSKGEAAAMRYILALPENFIETLESTLVAQESQDDDEADLARDDTDRREARQHAGERDIWDAG